MAQALIERNLARYIDGPEYASWFEVERGTADLLMAYLVAILSRASKDRWCPITDRRESLGAFERLHGKTPSERDTDGIVAETEPIRTHVLRNLLPAPRV